MSPGRLKQEAALLKHKESVDGARKGIRRWARWGQEVNYHCCRCYCSYYRLCMGSNSFALIFGAIRFILLVSQGYKSL